MLPAMNRQQLTGYLEAIDRGLSADAVLYVYGSAACILLDEPERTSLAIDVAGPYSTVDEGDLRAAADRAGLTVNPGEDHAGDHIEWVRPLRLCLQPPAEGGGLTLWQGARLRVRTGSIAELIASKLIRYDEVDQGDIRYLLSQARLRFADVQDAVARLPEPFRDDPVVRENLAALRTDRTAWEMPP